MAAVLWVSGSPAVAQKFPVPDLSQAVSGYFLYAALDRHCTTPSPERAEALEKYKKQFVAQAREVLADQPNVPPDVYEKLARLERDGPTDADLAPIEKRISADTPEQFAAGCATAVKDINFQMRSDEQLLQMLRKLKLRMASPTSAAAASRPSVSASAPGR